MNRKIITLFIIGVMIFSSFTPITLANGNRVLKDEKEDIAEVSIDKFTDVPLTSNKSEDNDELFNTFIGEANKTAEKDLIKKDSVDIEEITISNKDDWYNIEFKLASEIEIKEKYDSYAFAVRFNCSEKVFLIVTLLDNITYNYKVVKNDKAVEYEQAVDVGNDDSWDILVDEKYADISDFKQPKFSIKEEHLCNDLLESNITIEFFVGFKEQTGDVFYIDFLIFKDVSEENWLLENLWWIFLIGAGIGIGFAGLFYIIRRYNLKFKLDLKRNPRKRSDKK